MRQERFQTLGLPSMIPLCSPRGASARSAWPTDPLSAPRAKGRKGVRSLNQHRWVLTTCEEAGSLTGHQQARPRAKKGRDVSNTMSQPLLRRHLSHSLCLEPHLGLEMHIPDTEEASGGRSEFPCRQSEVPSTVTLKGRRTVTCLSLSSV